MLRAAGFKKIEILFFQRYGFTNHLGWFVENRPGGHSFLTKLAIGKLTMSIRIFLFEKKEQTL